MSVRPVLKKILEDFDSKFLGLHQVYVLFQIVYAFPKVNPRDSMPLRLHMSSCKSITYLQFHVSLNLVVYLPWTQQLGWSRFNSIVSLKHYTMMIKKATTLWITTSNMISNKHIQLFSRISGHMIGITPELCTGFSPDPRTAPHLDQSFIPKQGGANSQAR